MSLRARLVNAALNVLEAQAPGLGDALRELDAWASGREPIEPPPHPRTTESDEADTLVVEITDERGRVVGYTTAQRLKE